MKAYSACCLLFGFFWLVAGPTAAGQEGTGDDALRAALDALRASPGEDAGWIELQAVFDERIAAERADGLMDVALDLTADFDERCEAWVLLGKVYLGQAGAIMGLTGFEGNFRQSLLYQAADAFRTALDRSPSSIEAGSHLAFSLFLLKNFTGARREAQSLIDSHPEEAYPLYLLGEIELRALNHDSALQLFNRAREKDGNLVDALSGAVRALVALERYGAAGDELVRLAALDPQRGETASLAYAIHEPHEDYLAASALYRKILSVAPDRIEIVFLLAVVEYRLDDIDGAAAHIGEILSADANFDGAYYFEGLLREKNRLYDEAALSYRQVLGKEGLYFEHATDRLKVLAFRKAGDGSYEDAIEIYDDLLAILPFDSVLASNRALALAQCGRPDEADRAYERILETSPRDTQVLNDYALHMMGTGRTDEALAMLDRAYSIDGNLDSCENLGAYHLFVRGDAQRAARYLNLVLEADPEREKSLILLERINRGVFGRSGD